MKKASFSEGDVVSTLGYHSVGDGGAATYIIVKIPYAYGDDMTLISLLTSDVLKAKLIYDKFVSPIQCGAYGDGIHDDSDIISRLIKLKIPVKFPKKTFRLSLTIDSSDQMDLLDFNGCTLKNVNGNILTIASKSAYNQIYNLLVKDVTFLCGTSPILISNACKAVIYNCTFSIDPDITENSTLSVLKITNSYHVNIIHCIFNDTGNEKFALIDSTSGNDGLVVSDCTFNNIATVPIRVTGTYADITRCIFSTFESSDYAYNFNHVIIGQSTKVMIDDCYFINKMNIIELFKMEKDSILTITNSAFANMATFGYFDAACNIIFDKLNSIQAANDSRQNYVFNYSISDVNVYIHGFIYYDLYNAKNCSMYPYNSYNDRTKCKFFSPMANYSSSEAIQCASSSGDIYIDALLFCSGYTSRPMQFIINTSIFFTHDKCDYINNIYNASDGQVIAVYGNSDCYLNNGYARGNIDIPNDDGSYSKIYLSEIKPILLKYNKTLAKWKKIK